MFTFAFRCSIGVIHYDGMYQLIVYLEDDACLRRQSVFCFSLQRYIDFFKGHRHNDLYFEGIHQSYFRSLASGKTPLDCGKSMETCLSGELQPLLLFYIRTIQKIQAYLCDNFFIIFKILKADLTASNTVLAEAKQTKNVLFQRITKTKLRHEISNPW